MLTCLKVVLSGLSLVLPICFAGVTNADYAVQQVVPQIPQLSAKCCIKAWCSNAPGTIAYATGCGATPQQACDSAKAAAAVILNCSAGTLVYSTVTCSPYAVCSESVAAISKDSTGITDIKTDENLWEVEYRCCCRDGQTVIVRAPGKTFCQAKERARLEARWHADQEHCGAVCCRWTVVKRPLCCCNHCR